MVDWNMISSIISFIPMIIIINYQLSSVIIAIVSISGSNYTNISASIIEIIRLTNDQIIKTWISRD